MSRRLLLLLLVPALVGTMVGVGAAKLRPGRSGVAAQQEAAAAVAPDTLDPGLAQKSSKLERADRQRREKQRKQRRERKERKDDDKFTFDVAAVQQKLAEGKYYFGPVDGEAGVGFSAAVMAFQKVQGIGADGAVGPQTLAALKNPKQPSLKGGAGTRIEVDLTKQVLYYVKDGALVRIMPVSSGNGETYSIEGGGTARALTPVGNYAVQRKIPGTRVAALGELYDPMYFYQGWAIHGSNSVPAYPASHGCIRVTRADAIWLYSRVPVGMSVSIYGGTHTFTAGSSAPGTSAPAGDTDEDTKPEPEEEPKPSDDSTGGDSDDDAKDPEPTKPSPKPEPTEDEPSEEPSPKPSRSPKPDPEPEPEPEDPEDPPVDPSDPPVSD